MQRFAYARQVCSVVLVAVTGLFFYFGKTGLHFANTWSDHVVGIWVNIPKVFYDDQPLENLFPSPLNAVYEVNSSLKTNTDRLEIGKALNLIRSDGHYNVRSSGASRWHHGFDFDILNMLPVLRLGSAGRSCRDCVQFKQVFGGITDVKAEAQLGILKVYPHFPLPNLHPLPECMFLKNDASFGGIGGLLRGMGLPIYGVDSAEGHTYSHNRGQQIESIETVFAGVIGIAMFGLSLWLMYGGGERGATRLVLFYLCFIASIFCAAIVEQATNR